MHYLHRAFHCLRLLHVLSYYKTVNAVRHVHTLNVKIHVPPVIISVYIYIYSSGCRASISRDGVCPVCDIVMRNVHIHFRKGVCYFPTGEML